MHTQPHNLRPNTAQQIRIPRFIVCAPHAHKYQLVKLFGVENWTASEG